MLRIRLARTGKKKQASYRVVVADQRKAVTAKFKEILGWYNPHTKEFKVNKEKTEAWLAQGASPTDSLAILLKKNGVNLPDWVKIVEKNKKPKNAEEPKEETPKAEAPADDAAKEVVEEAPSEETVEAEITEEEKKEADVPEETPKEEAPAEEIKEEPVEEKKEEPKEEEKSEEKKEASEETK